jgi:hypothetical protein
MIKPIKTTKSIVISKMGNGLSFRATWYDGKKDHQLSGKHKDVLPTVIDNLFKLRDGQKVSNIYK